MPALDTPTLAHRYDPMPGGGNQACRRCWRRKRAPAHVAWERMDALRRGVDLHEQEGVCECGHRGAHHWASACDIADCACEADV